MMLGKALSPFCIQVAHTVTSDSRGTKVGKLLILAPERYTARLSMVTKVFYGVSETAVEQTRSTCITPEQSDFYGRPARTCENIIFLNVIYMYFHKKDRDSHIEFTCWISFAPGYSFMYS